MRFRETVNAQVAGAPAQHSSSYGLNLAAAGLATFYAIYVMWQAVSGMMCSQLGADYCEYLSAGAVANAHGYAAVYDLGLLEQAQRVVLPTAPGSAAIPVLPFLYLPIFVLPFQLLSRVQPATGFWIWTVINAALLILYARSFLRRLALPPASPRLTLFVFLSLPVFINLFLGQMNVLLAVCVGEFIVAALEQRFFSAGMWLAGLLLKPQLLLLVGLVLLVQRACKVLAGAAAASGVLVLLSALMVGAAGLRAMLSGWLSAAGGQANVWVQGMMNWRMFGTHLAAWLGSGVGWSIAVIGMLATLAWMLITWRQPLIPGSLQWPIGVAGVLAAASTLAWHSHIHMAVMLIPALLYLHQAGVLPKRVLDFWIFAPAIVFAAMVFIPEALMAMGLLPASTQTVIYFVLGTAQLSANLYLFGWAARAARGHTPVSLAQATR